MNHSDWQLSRIRNALRAYHRYERSHDGTYFTWNDVQEAIDEYTGVKVLAERLRQFVEGVKVKKDGIVIGRKHPAPKDASLTAIVKFVTHEDIDLLNKDELKEFLPNRQAPMRLLEYLDQDFDTVRIPPPPTLEGEYEAKKKAPSGLFNFKITLERADDSGIIQTTIIEEYYQNENKFPVSGWSAEQEIANIDDWSEKERKKYFKSRQKFGGWAILSPEDNLVIFLKNESNGSNCYYFTLAIDEDIWSEDNCNYLLLMEHGLPLELDMHSKIANSNMKQGYSDFVDNVLLFTRSDGNILCKGYFS